MTTKPTTPTTIGDRIRAARLAANLTQEAAAAKYGCKQSEWSRLEQATDLRYSTIERAAAAIGCAAKDLM